MLLTDFSPLQPPTRMKQWCSRATNSVIVINGRHRKIQQEISRCLQQQLPTNFVIVDLFTALDMLGNSNISNKPLLSLGQAVTYNPEATNAIIEQFHALALELINLEQPLIICHELWHHPLFQKTVGLIELQQPLTVHIGEQHPHAYRYSLQFDPTIYDAQSISDIICQSIVQ